MPSYDEMTERELLAAGAESLGRIATALAAIGSADTTPPCALDTLADAIRESADNLDSALMCVAEAVNALAEAAKR